MKISILALCLVLGINPADTRTTTAVYNDYDSIVTIEDGEEWALDEPREDINGGDVVTIVFDTLGDNNPYNDEILRIYK